MKSVAALATAALVAAVPASLGLLGNTEFSQAIPVRPPASATLLDSAGRPVPAHRDADKAPGDRTGTRADGRTAEDRVADRARGAARPEPGSQVARDDRASDDRASDDRASDDRASDDRASDDRGSADRRDDGRDDRRDDRSGPNRGSDDGRDDRSGSSHGGDDGRDDHSGSSDGRDDEDGGGGHRSDD